MIIGEFAWLKLGACACVCVSVRVRVRACVRVRVRACVRARVRVPAHPQWSLIQCRDSCFSYLGCDV